MSAAEKIVTAEKTVTTDNKYAALEQKILAAITAGKNRHVMLYEDPIIREEARAFITQKANVSRVVEARTKALRVRGLIKYDSKSGWVINV